MVYSTDIEEGTCVSCGVDATDIGLGQHSHTCSNCSQTFHQCEFCHEEIGTVVYTCPYCEHTSLLPQLTLTLAALPGIDQLCYRASLRKLRRLETGDSTIEDVLQTANEFRGHGLYRHLTTIQIETEFVEAVETVAKHDPETVLEIGTCRGGTLYVWSRYLQPTKAISLDLPGGLFGGGYPAQKVKFFDAFSDRTDLTCIRDDSHDERTLETVRDALDGGSVDFLFIDGDHTYEGVKQDFEMYAPLVDDGIVALHDIEHRMNDDPDSFYGVKRFWKELEQEYETETFVADEEYPYGIGLVYL